MDSDIESLQNQQFKILRRYTTLTILQLICQISLFVCAVPLLALMTLKTKGMLPFSPIYLFALSALALLLTIISPILEILKGKALKKCQKINLQIVSRLKPPLSQ